MSALLATQDRQLGAQLELHLNYSPLHFDPFGSFLGCSGDIEVYGALQHLHYSPKKTRKGRNVADCNLNVNLIVHELGPSCAASIVLVALTLYLKLIFLQRSQPQPIDERTTLVASGKCVLLGQSLDVNKS